jgi:hypothetical protein
MIDPANIQGMSADYYEKKMTGSPEKFKIKDKLVIPSFL